MTRMRETDQRTSSAPDLDTRPVDAVLATHDAHTVTTDAGAERRTLAGRPAQAASLVFGVVIALIAIRFAMLLFGANPAAGFTTFVYDITNPLVAPFEGIFGAPTLETGVFDPASLVAIVVYALVAWLVAGVIRLVSSDTRSDIRSRTRRIDTEMR